MKQHITENQYNELMPVQNEVWEKWMRKHHYTMSEVYPMSSYDEYTLISFPSIGQMIEFLGERNDMPWSILKKSEWHGGDFDVIFAREQLKELTEVAMAKNML